MLLHLLAVHALHVGLVDPVLDMLCELGLLVLPPGLVLVRSIGLLRVFDKFESR